MKKYFYDEKFEFLVVKTFDMGCYGFNLKCADQCATAKKIIQDVNSMMTIQLELSFSKTLKKLQKGFTDI